MVLNKIDKKKLLDAFASIKKDINRLEQKFNRDIGSVRTELRTEP